MGQGVNTKIRQLVADEFGLDVDRVVRDAHQHREEQQHLAHRRLRRHRPQRRRRRRRLPADQAAAAAVRRRAPGRSADGLSASRVARPVSRRRTCTTAAGPKSRIAFGQLCAEARRERVDLGARGFYATPGVDFNRETGRGTPFFYYTQGAAVAEVLDRPLHRRAARAARRPADRHRPLDQPRRRPRPGHRRLHPGHGLGHRPKRSSTTRSGELLSHSPTTYKIPAITDVPADFNVATFDNNDNVRNVYRSKAVGEPPLMLGIAVWAAVKNALAYVSPEAAAALHAARHRRRNPAVPDAWQHSMPHVNTQRMS